jgi:transposase
MHTPLPDDRLLLIGVGRHYLWCPSATLLGEVDQRLAVQGGSQLYTDSASSYRALQGYMHEVVNHTQKAYARGEVHAHRAECLCSFLKPYLRGVQGVSKRHFPGYGGFFPFLRNTRHRNACAQTEMILPAA